MPNKPYDASHRGGERLGTSAVVQAWRRPFKNSSHICSHRDSLSQLLKGHVRGCQGQSLPFFRRNPIGPPPPTSRARRPLSAGHFQPRPVQRRITTITILLFTYIVKVSHSPNIATSKHGRPITSFPVHVTNTSRPGEAVHMWSTRRYGIHEKRLIRAHKRLREAQIAASPYRAALFVD